MMDFGKELRAAREAKGYTVAQLVEMTHLAPTTIDDLERGNVKRIAAPIYGRGFVKLYCEAVGIDPKPFVAEFMEIMNGNRDSQIRERPIETKATEVESAAEVAPKIEPPPPLRDELPLDEPLHAEPPPIPEKPLFSEEPAERPSQTITRYSEPIKFLRDAAPTIWRMGLLGFVAIALIAGIAWGLFALRRATAPSHGDAASSPRPQARATSRGAAQARQQQAIPALYID